jgi:isopentenyl-diphosphate delta-isomerase
MTGGPDIGGKINHNLAIAAENAKIPLCLGSMRIAIEKPEMMKSFQVRKLCPSIPLLANLGAVQLNYGFSIKDCQKIVDSVEADALILHLNPIHEAVQHEGNTDFTDLISKIDMISKELSVPVVVKEVGFGISREIAEKLSKTNIKAIFTDGKGGTNWALIEGMRSNNRIGETFKSWGIPTTESIKQVKSVYNGTIVGSGGVRSGIDIAKALSLGADCAGIGRPFLKPAIESPEAITEQIKKYIKELKIAMFGLGIKKISEFDTSKLISN